MGPIHKLFLNGLSNVPIIPCKFRVVDRGRTCKEFIGGCWPLGTDFLQKWFRKGMMPQRHRLIFLSLSLMLHISIVIVYPIIFLSSLFSTIVAIKEVAILGYKILGSIEWQNFERSRGVREHGPPEKFLIYGALNRDFLHSDTSFWVFSEFYNIL